MQDYVPDIPKDNFLVEPQGRNTAPCLVLATASSTLKIPKPLWPCFRPITRSSRRSSSGTNFWQALKWPPRTELLITFGIPPDFPATGYGYLRFKKDTAQTVAGENFYSVQEFKEKPDAATARDFVACRQLLLEFRDVYLAGTDFAKKLKECAPDFYAHWQTILDAVRSGKIGSYRGTLS